MSVIGSQPDVRDRRPDQRNAQRPLTPADDPGIVQVEMVVARVDLDRPRTALGDRAFRRQAIECAVLIPAAVAARQDIADRSEEHTSELQSLMRISYAVFCLKKKKSQINKSYTAPDH